MYVFDNTSELVVTVLAWKSIIGRVGCTVGWALMPWARRKARNTEHQLFQVTERSISIDFSSNHDSNAFLNLFPNLLSPLQALWQARYSLLSFSSLVS